METDSYFEGIIRKSEEKRKESRQRGRDILLTIDEEIVFSNDVLQ